MKKKEFLDHNEMLRHLVAEGKADDVQPYMIKDFVDLCEYARGHGEREENGMYSIDLTADEMCVELDYNRRRIAHLLDYAVKTGVVSREKVEGAKCLKTSFDLARFEKKES